MEGRKFFQNRIMRTAIAAVLFLACCFGAYRWLASYTRDDGGRLLLAYAISGPLGEAVGEYPLENGSEYAVNLAGDVVLTAELPETRKDWYSYLVIYDNGGDLKNLEILVDGVCLSDGFPCDPAGNGGLFLTLPLACAYKTLSIRYTKSAGTFYPSVYLTDALTEQQLYAAQANLDVLLAGAFAVMSLVLLGMFFYGFATESTDPTVLVLAFGTFSQALRHTAFFMRVPSLVGLAAALSNGILYTAPTLYLLLRMKDKRRKTALSVCLSLCDVLYFAVEVCAYGPFPVFAMQMIAWQAGAVFCIPIILTLACSVLECKAEVYEFRVLLCGLGLGLCAAAVHIAWLLALGGLEYSVWSVVGANITDLAPDIPLNWLNLYLLVLCFAISILSVFRRAMERSVELAMLSMRDRLNREQLEIAKEQAESIGKLRHDMRGHYIALMGFAKRGENQKAVQYLEDLMETEEMIPDIHYTENAAINAILATQLSRAAKAGIRVRAKCQIPAEIPFPESDVCSLLMNLLKNAMEACLSIPGGKDRWIRVDIHLKNQYLYISVENAKSNALVYHEDTGLYSTTKKDGSVHGFGLRSVQAIARKYHSELLLESTEESFSASTALLSP